MLSSSYLTCHGSRNRCLEHVNQTLHVQTHPIQTPVVAILFVLSAVFTSQPLEILLVKRAFAV